MPPFTEEQRDRLRAILQRPDPPAPERLPVPALPPMPRLKPARAPRMPRVDTRVLAGVYFIRSGDKVKIGVSTNVPMRLKALQTMSAGDIELLVVAEGSHPEESQLHARFAHLRTHGEWFRAEPELLEFIAALTAPNS
jgi:hypothetical protein